MPPPLGIEAEADKAERRNLLLTVPAIGEVSAAVLIAELPILGAIDDKQLAALVGVATMAHDSGTWTTLFRWRPRHCPMRPLYGNALGQPLQPGHQDVPQQAARRGQTAQGRHAKAHHHDQHHS
nr:transposase [Rhizobium leguminosarum]